MSGYLPSDSLNLGGLKKGGSKYGTFVENDVSDKEAMAERAKNLAAELRSLQSALDYTIAREKQAADIGDLYGAREAHEQQKTLLKDIGAKKIELAAAQGGLKNDDSAAGPGTDSSNLGFDQTEKSTTADRSKEESRYISRSELKKYGEKENASHSKCVSCDASHPVDQMEKNEHGAGYLCKACAKDWNAENHEGPRTPMRQNAGEKKRFKEERDRQAGLIDDMTRRLHAFEGDDGAGSHNEEPEVRKLLQQIKEAEQLRDAAHRGYLEAHDKQNSSADGLADDPDAGTFSNEDGPKVVEDAPDDFSIVVRGKKVREGLHKDEVAGAMAEVKKEGVKNSDPKLDELSMKLYGKRYSELPDDGAEQDHVMSEYEKQKKNSVKNASFNVHCPKCDELTKHTGDEQAGNRRCTECGTDYAMKDGKWVAKNGGDYWNERTRVENASESDLARAWEQFAEDMVDDLGLGDMATADPSTGRLHSYGQQPFKVRQIWKDSYEDVHEKRKNSGSGDMLCEDCGKRLDLKTAAAVDNNRVGKALCESCFHKRGMRHSSDAVCPKCGIKVNHSGTPGPLIPGAAEKKENAALSTCKKCGKFINPAFGKDEPSKHQDASGTRQDPRAPGDYDDICDACGYSNEKRNMPDGTLTDPEHMERDNSLFLPMCKCGHVDEEHMPDGPDTLGQCEKCSCDKYKYGGTEARVNDKSARELAMEHHNGLGLGASKYGSKENSEALVKLPSPGDKCPNCGNGRIKEYADKSTGCDGCGKSYKRAGAQ